MQNLPVTRSEKIEALRRNPYFASLDERVLLDLSQGTILQRYEPGELMCWQGEPCCGLHMVQSGSVKLFRLSPKGRELIIRVMLAGESFNEAPVFDGGPNVVNAAALEPSDVWTVDAEPIRREIADHPEMAQVVIQHLAQNLRMLVGKVEELSFYQVTHRLARLIGEMSPQELGDCADGRGTAARLTQGQLAARLGTVREVVARALRELERSGAIRVERRRICVVDEALLRNWYPEDCV